MNSVDVDNALKMAMKQTSLMVTPALAAKIEDTLASLPDTAILIRRSKRVRKLGYLAASIVIVAGLFMGMIVFLPQTTANLNQIPVVGPIAVKTANWGSHLAAENGLAHQQATDQGITLTIKNVIYDGLRFSMDYSLYSADEMKTADMDFVLKINGVPIGSIESVKGSTREYGAQRVNSHTFEGAIKATFYNYRPTEFKLKLNVTRIGDNKGDWTIAFPVSETNQVQLLTPNVVKTASDMSLRVNNIRQTPLSSEIDFDFQATNMKNNFDMGFELTDDKGTIYDYWDTGSHFKDTRANSTHGTGRLIIDKPKESIKYFILQPFFYDTDFSQKSYFGAGSFDQYNRGTFNREPSVEQPIILAQGPAGKLFITKIDYQKDKMVVRYHTEGSNPHAQANFWMQDEQGNWVNALPGREVLSGIERIREFPALSENSKPTFVTMPIVAHIPIPELETRIDLPQ